MEPRPARRRRRGATIDSRRGEATPVIKVLAPALRHPTNRSLADFHRYWADTHGPLYVNSPKLRRYVQHLTLPEAYGGEPAPTFDGVSMFWFDRLSDYGMPAD